MDWPEREKLTRPIRAGPPIPSTPLFSMYMLRGSMAVFYRSRVKLLCGGVGDEQDRQEIEDEHQSQVGFGFGVGAGEFLPGEDSPEGCDHRRRLTDRVRDGDAGLRRSD